MPPPNDCADCRFFRSYRPLSQLLAEDLGGTDGQVISELLKIMQDERQKKDAEAEMKVETFRQGRLEWNVRPSMSDYCGLREGENVYFVHELKNPKRACEDFAARVDERACASCKHRVTGVGPARDQEAMRRRSNLAALAAVTDGARNDATIESYLELVQSLKVFEIAQAYYNGRFVTKKPDYLSLCAERSRDRTHLPCVVENPHDACADWRSAEDDASTMPPSAASASEGTKRAPADFMAALRIDRKNT